MLVGAALLAACGSSVPNPKTVAAAAGATSCDNSGFYIESKLAGTKATVYDCEFVGKTPECVTYDGGLAQDATQEVAFLFSNTLGSQRPQCLVEHNQAEARLATAKRLAREQAWGQKFARSAQEPWHKGYTPDLGSLGHYQLPNVYWEWATGGSCAAFAQFGCWKVQVITRNGCPTYLSVQANVYQGSTVVGNIIGANDSGIPPLTPAIIEMDAESGDASQDSARITSITCG